MIKESELILNSDGSVFHLHLKPEHLADSVLLVGDPGRVSMISGMLDHIEFTASNREFRSATGSYHGRLFTVISTGIGTDNIDIVLNELDALANINLKTREVREELRSLKIIRIGTTGGLQADTPVNSWIVSKKSVGFDGLLNFYASRNRVCDLSFEESLKSYLAWPSWLPTPYVVDASDLLLPLFSDDRFIQGVNISAPGFYGPQGRVLRLPLAIPDINEKLEQFRYNNLKITNYEMESSAIYGLSRMLGHEALTVCLLIANRRSFAANENYQANMEIFLRAVLDNLTV